MGSAIVCPEAGEAVPFRIKTDAKTVVQAWESLRSCAVSTLRRAPRPHL